MTPIPDSLQSFAESYTAAWCSGQPKSVANHYIANGSLCINDGDVAVGRSEITESAKAFMDAFPDMRVVLDRLELNDHLTEYHWTLTGTNTGRGGTGRAVHISGFEVWRLSKDGLITESQGFFDAAEYQRQLNA